MTSNPNSSASFAASSNPVQEDIYFCHTCESRVDRINEDFTCRHCNQGFLERVEETILNEDEHQQMHFDFTGGQNVNQGFQQVFHQILGNILSENGPSGRQNANVGSNIPNRSDSNSVGGPNVLTVFLSQLMQNLNAEGGRIQVHFDNDELNQPGGGATIFNFPALHANPGDYAWGPGGLDQIVTQLLNQFEGGAPPLNANDISRIVRTQITQEQVEKRMQCTTCMEDFALGETVRQLSCCHCFHEDCILPWLARHNTCPICRKTVDIPKAEQKPNPPTSGGNSSAMFDAIDELD